MELKDSIGDSLPRKFPLYDRRRRNLNSGHHGSDIAKIPRLEIAKIDASPQPAAGKDLAGKPQNDGLNFPQSCQMEKNIIKDHSIWTICQCNILNRASKKLLSVIRNLDWEPLHRYDANTPIM